MNAKQKRFGLTIFMILIAITVATASDIRRHKGETNMTTKETINGYFNALKNKSGWDSFLGDNITFTSFTSPVKQVSGKAAYIEATKRFYSTVVSMELRELIVEGDKACALTRYELRGPTGQFTSDVSEIFTVTNGKIQSFGIYFDSAPFPK